MLHCVNMPPEHESAQVSDDKLFPVTAISRADLRRTELSAAEIASLNDIDMQKIAQQLEDQLVNAVFWYALGDAAQDVLSQKPQQADNQQPGGP